MWSAALGGRATEYGPEAHSEPSYHDRIQRFYPDDGEYILQSSKGEARL